MISISYTQPPALLGVPARTTKRLHQLTELLNTNEQIVRAWVREGIIPAHRKPGGRKFTYLRHEIFDWLISNRYDPGSDAPG